jgi:hypothetical protein
MKRCARHISLCLTMGYQFPRRNHHILIPLRISHIGLCQKAHIYIRDTYLPDLHPRKNWRWTIPCTSHMSIDIGALGSHYLVYQLDSNTKPPVTLDYRCLAMAVLEAATHDGATALRIAAERYGCILSLLPLPSSPPTAVIQFPWAARHC